MDKQTISKIARNVERNFPGVRWGNPRIQHTPGPRPKSGGAKESFLLIFSGAAEGQDGRRIPRQVRVVADEKGHILRMSTSR